MKNIKIKDKNYGLAVNFKHDKEIRTSFNNLTQDTYGFNFEDWYKNGYWGDSYIPYALLDEKRVISNVSVNVIDFIIEGEKKIGIQIGTVMTDKDYRKQGLNRYIMEYVLDEWKEKSDFIYLFANDRVLDFYPKFNFMAVNEYQYSKLITSSKDSKVKKLNMAEVKDREFLVGRIKKSKPGSKLSMHGNSSLIMFYCTSFMKESVYYLEDLDAVVIAEYEEDTLYLNEIFSNIDVNLNDIVEEMVRKDTKKVVLGFTPLDATDYNCNVLREEDITLFVIKDNIDNFR